ncbi:hypothetical protein JOQ06_009099, partial [Pogonophryne albipinna]
MQQERLSSQDAAGEAVVPGCCRRGCRPRMQQERLSSQDAAGEAVVPGCSRRGCPPRMQQGVTAEDMILLLASMGEDFVLPLLDMRCAAAEAVLPGCNRRVCPPRMQQQRLSSQDVAGRHSRGYDLTARLDGGRFCAAPLGYEDMILLLASMGEDFVLPLLDM